MERTILIAGQGGTLDAALAREAMARGHAVVLARDPHGEPGAVAAGARAVRWNPPSPLSARAMLLECGDGPDALVVALERFGRPGEFSSSGPAEVDEAVDGSLRGLFHVCREAVARFSRRGGGRIVVALREAEGMGPVASALVAAAKEFALSLGEARAAGDPAAPRIHGLSCAPGQEEALAAQAIELACGPEAARSQTRWIKVGGRGFPWSRQ